MPADHAPNSSVTEAVIQLNVSRDRGVSWLLSRIGDDGEPVDAGIVNSWYRVPWVLATVGRIPEAARVMSWIERHALSAAGDLVPGPPQNPWTNANACYPLAILAVGAWHLERYDTASAIMDTLTMSFVDAETGGAYVERPEHRSTGRQDVLCTAQLGLAALETGREDLAHGVYNWMTELLAAQPGLPDTLYLSRTRDGLVRDFAQDQAFGHVIEFQQPRQAYFNPGIGAAFLGRYHQRIGQPSALALANDLLTLSSGGTEMQYDYADTVHVGKLAWGASVVLDSDAGDSTLAILLRMTQWFVDCQEADGRWNPSHFLFPEPTEGDALWKTGEHIMIINQMMAALSGIHRGPVGRDR